MPVRVEQPSPFNSHGAMSYVVDPKPHALEDLALAGPD